MLSLHAEPFYPGTENIQFERDPIVTTENVKNEPKENANHKINTKKDKENKLEKSEQKEKNNDQLLSNQNEWIKIKIKSNKV